jgi:polyphosphate glucokinase
LEPETCFLDRATLTATTMAPTTAAAITTSITACRMAPITEPTIRNAISMPTPMAATLNQRIRRILSRASSPPGRDITRLPRFFPLADTLGPMHALGIDIGGTGIKGAPVDVDTGKLLAPRQKIATPRPAKPEPIADVVKQLTTAFDWSGPVGITFPGVVTDGVTRTAANLDPSWIGTDAGVLFDQATGNRVRVLNDADAAGVAEMTFGAGVGQKGTVLMLTFGTGIGSALFVQGILVPNTEFGHIEIRGHDAEKRASERAKELGDLSWGKWAGRVDEYLQHIEALLSPNLIIVGGGISKDADKWVPRLTGIRARIVPAVLLNNAGIVGAAMAAVPDSVVPDTSGATGTAS